MKKKIVFATSNPHKLEELKAICEDKCNVEFILPPSGFDPVEDGVTFEANSLKKAREAARISDMPALADDSGLCVEALDGGPGIHSARYAETAQKRSCGHIGRTRTATPKSGNKGWTSRIRCLNYKVS